jgi:peptidyl-prolyl cis-trans isomerase-like 3
LALCASGYYNGTKFHRLIPSFMIQGGDPGGNGKGGQSIWGSPFEDEFHPALTHGKRGIVSMANSGPNTNASQFFITFGAHHHLDGKYTIIGQVIDHWEVLDAMEAVPVGKKDRPVEPIVLNNLTIHANPIATKNM